MAHYDIYQSLGLDRTASTSDLARDIDSKLAATSPTDAGAQEELSTARAILGDDNRRSLYDQRLNDPTAPEIDIDSLRELAALNVGGSAAADSPGKGQQFQQQAGQFARTAGAKTSAATHQVQDSFKQSKLLAIVITAIVTAVVVGLAGWFFGLFGSDPNKEAKGVVNELLDQDDEDDLRSWIKDNSTHEDRDSLMSSLELDDDGSFNGMDALFGGSDLKAGKLLLDSEQFRMVSGYSKDDFYENAEENGYTEEEADSVVSISVVDENDKERGVVGLIERDGDYQITEVETVE
jgi:curved DNA-binding protein CbpA